jgi:hypothetical protein
MRHALFSERLFRHLRERKIDECIQLRFVLKIIVYAMGCHNAAGAHIETNGIPVIGLSL